MLELLEHSCCKKWQKSSEQKLKTINYVVKAEVEKPYNQKNFKSKYIPRIESLVQNQPT